MGIESGSDMLLGNVNKILRQKVREGVANAKAAGLQTVGLFMIGLPEETPEMTRETVEFSVDLDLDFAKYANYSSLSRIKNCLKIAGKKICFGTIGRIIPPLIQIRIV